MRVLALITLVSLLAACAPASLSFPVVSKFPESSIKAEGDNPLALRQMPFNRLPGWDASDLKGVLPAFMASCERLRPQPATRQMGALKEFGTVADWVSLCDDLAAQSHQSNSAIRYFFETRFRAYLVYNEDNPSGLFTGYYEAQLNGSWTPGGAYNVPLYARPDDLISVDLGDFRSELAGTTIAGRIVGNAFEPYPDRAAINAGALAGRQLEVLWTNSAIDTFFLHIQGSGRVILEDGSFVRVGYAGRNGQRYVAVGRELIAAGIISQDQMSMQAIRGWMEANPVAAMALMNANPSYVFFRILDELNPVGAQGAPLTPGYSLAVDKRYIPFGTLLWLDTTDPRDPERETPLQRIVVAQDTGSAIKGPVRGDLFWGFGPQAALAAGGMKEQGNYYVLLPNIVRSTSYSGSGS